MASSAGNDSTAWGGKYTFTGDDALKKAEEIIFQYELKSLTSFVKVKAPKKFEMSGSYMMIVGQLLQSGAVPVMRAIKLQNLSNNIAMSTIWPLEVIDELGQNR